MRHPGGWCLDITPDSGTVCVTDVTIRSPEQGGTWGGVGGSLAGPKESGSRRTEPEMPVHRGSRAVAGFFWKEPDASWLVLVGHVVSVITLTLPLPHETIHRQINMRAFQESLVSGQGACLMGYALKGERPQKP